MGGPTETSRAFRAMGSECVARVVIDHDRAQPILDRVVERMNALERCWSRFLVESELSRLNSHAGAPVFVSPDLFSVISLAVDAWRATGGRFDPTLLDPLRELGYDASFDEFVEDRVIEATHSSPTPTRVGEIELDFRSSLVHTPPGVHFDLGGIGKGHAADLVFQQMMEDGATGACLDFGGDIRVGGSTLEGGGWVIVVDDPFAPGADLALLGLGDGSVTTSSRLRRAWSTPEGGAHHLLDPATSRSSTSGLATVTVIAARAGWGEAHAKAALIAGASQGAALIEGAGLSGLLITDEGEQIRAGSFDEFVLGGATSDVRSMTTDS